MTHIKTSQTYYYVPLIKQCSIYCMGVLWNFAISDWRKPIIMQPRCILATVNNCISWIICLFSIIGQHSVI